MAILSEIRQVRNVLQRFQDGYATRDKFKLDEFMGLFTLTDEIEWIGVGASEHRGNEWFNGQAAIREIIEGHWTDWGAVNKDVDGTRLAVFGETDWFSSNGTLTSGDEYE